MEDEIKEQENVIKSLKWYKKHDNHNFITNDDIKKEKQKFKEMKKESRKSFFVFWLFIFSFVLLILLFNIPSIIKLICRIKFIFM